MNEVGLEFLRIHLDVHEVCTSSAILLPISRSQAGAWMWKHNTDHILYLLVIVASIGSNGYARQFTYTVRAADWTASL